MYVVQILFATGWLTVTSGYSLDEALKIRQLIVSRGDAPFNETRVVNAYYHAGKWHVANPLR